MLSDVRGSSYEEKLQDAGLTTLVERRKRGDAIETFKTLKGINRVDKEQWFTTVSANARSTRSTTSVSEEGEERREWMLQVERASLEVRRNFFTIRAAKEWNIVPDEVKKKNSVNSFKNAYDAWKKADAATTTTTTTTIAGNGGPGEDNNVEERVEANERNH